MTGTIVWALLTGFVTGALWIGIVIFRRQQRVAQQQREVLESAQRRLDELETVEQRLAEVEERLDFAERLLKQQSETQRLPSSGS